LQRDALRAAIALFAAAATPATSLAFFQLMGQSRYFSGAAFEYALFAATNLWIIAFIIALFHAVLLGLPAYFFAKRFHLVSWWTAIAFGFVIGCVPFAIVSWPMTHVHAGYRAWDGKEMVDYLIDGKPTWAGWISYVYQSGAMGVIGMFSGFVAWLAWRSTAILTTSPSAR
jgi:hypothetical protein